MRGGKNAWFKAQANLSGFVFLRLFSFYQDVSVLIESPKHSMVNKIINFTKIWKEQLKGKKVEECQKLLITVNQFEKL